VRQFTTSESPAGRAIDWNTWANAGAAINASSIVHTTTNTLADRITAVTPHFEPGRLRRTGRAALWHEIG
jgi:hypothetical protein